MLMMYGILPSCVDILSVVLLYNTTDKNKCFIESVIN